MPDPTDTPSSTESPPPAGGDPNTSRRRLLQGGLAAAPVLMTLVSRPVLAQRTPLCTTPSGFVSANASTAGRGISCTGRTQGYWKNLSADQWPSPFLPGTLFNTAFNLSSSAAPFAGQTLLQVLTQGGGAPIYDVARTIVAALLNAAAGLTPVLTVQVVRHMWQEYSNTGFGFFSPSSGARWNHDELMDYLGTTQPL
jgi:hypothetical protein